MSNECNQSGNEFPNGNPAKGSQPLSRTSSKLGVGNRFEIIHERQEVRRLQSRLPYVRSNCTSRKFLPPEDFDTGKQTYSVGIDSLEASIGRDPIIY